MEINMHHSNVVIATFTAQGSVCSNAMADAFVAGKNGETFDLHLNIFEKVIEFFSGKVRQTATRLMNELGKQVRDFKNPDKTGAEKVASKTKAFELIAELTGMVDRGDVGEFCDLFSPLLVLFAADQDRQQTSVDNNLLPAGARVGWSACRPAKIVSPEELSRRQKEKWQDEERLFSADRMKIVPIEQTADDWILVSKPAIQLDESSGGSHVPGRGLFEIGSGNVSGNLNALTWEDINPDPGLPWELVEQPKPESLSISTASGVEADGLNPDSALNPYDQAIDYTVKKQTVQAVVNQPTTDIFSCFFW